MIKTVSDVAVGDVHTQLVVDRLTRTQIVQYAGASGDFNPVHTDESFATEVAGYPTVFAHGMLTMALTGVAISEFVGTEAVRTFGVRFQAQVWPGDTLTTTLTVTSVTPAERAITLDVRTRNQNGIEVLTGEATAILDG